MERWEPNINRNANSAHFMGSYMKDQPFFRPSVQLEKKGPGTETSSGLSAQWAIELASRASIAPRILGVEIS